MFKNILKKMMNTAKRKKKEQEQKQNFWAGMLFLFIGGSMTLVAALLLWKYVLVAPDLEKMLPEKDLIVLLSLENVGSADNTFRKIPDVAAVLNEMENTILGKNIESLSWHGDRGGIAFYALHEGTAEWSEGQITFLEVADKKAASDYLNTRAPDETTVFDSYALMTFLTPKTEYCTIFLGYLTCASHLELLESIIRAQDEPGIFLAESEDFQKVSAELPRRHRARLFLRTAALSELFPEDVRTSWFQPFSKMIGEIGGVLVEDERTSQIKTSFVLRRSDLGELKNIENERVSFSDEIPTLLKNLPMSTNMFLWGNDLFEDMENGFSYFEKVDPSFVLMARNTVQSKVEELFGGELSWTYDIIPLLESEFTVGADAAGFFLIVAPADPSFVSTKMEKIVVALKKMSAEFIPQIVSHTLSDGTVIEEVFPDEAAVVTEEVTLTNGKGFFIEARDDTGAVKFAVTVASEDNLLFIGKGKREITEIFPEDGKAPIAVNLPLKFAGASEEVIAVAPEFLQTWIPDEQLTLLKRLSGKFVNTPLFFRLDMTAEF